MITGNKPLSIFEELVVLFWYLFNKKRFNIFVIYINEGRTQRAAYNKVKEED